jgi:hypothetical protein
LRTATTQEFVVVLDFAICDLLRKCEISHTDVIENQTLKRRLELEDCAAVFASTPGGMSPEAAEELRRGPLARSIGDYVRGGGYVYAQDLGLLPSDLAPKDSWMKANGGEGLGVVKTEPHGWHPEAIRLTEAGLRSPFLMDAFRGRVINTGGTRRCPCEVTHDEHDGKTRFQVTGFDAERVQVLAEAPVGHAAGHEYHPAFITYGEKGLNRPLGPAMIPGKRPSPSIRPRQDGQRMCADG